MHIDSFVFLPTLEGKTFLEDQARGYDVNHRVYMYYQQLLWLIHYSPKLIAKQTSCVHIEGSLPELVVYNMFVRIV
jgi:hypothetical protein